MSEERSNLAKGRDSYDSLQGNTLVAFFNRNVSTYGTEAGCVRLNTWEIIHG